MKVGDIVEWTGRVQTVGANKEIAISPGDRRKITAISKDGKFITLVGASGLGSYGWCKIENVKTILHPKS